MRAFYLGSIWLYLVAAVSWVGRMVFLVLVLVPPVPERGAG